MKPSSTSGTEVFVKIVFILGMVFFWGENSVSFAQDMPPKKTETPQDKSLLPQEESPKPQPQDLGSLLVLEDVLIEGSARISKQRLLSLTGLSIGSKVKISELVAIRDNLAISGLFSEVRIFQKKTSKPSHIILRIQLKDDNSVYGDWAMGARLGVVLGELQASHASFNNPPLSQQLELVSRNLFRQQIRTRGFIDIDSVGTIRGGAFAFGLPRWGSESSSIDADFRIDDPALRFLNSFAYATKSSLVFSEPLKNKGRLVLGAVDYRNNDRRFRNPLFAERFYGIKLGALIDTRLQGFNPGKGYRIGLSATQGEARNNPRGSKLESTTAFELNLGGTVLLGSDIWLSLETDSYLENTEGSAWRTEVRFDIPAKIEAPEVSDGSWFVKLRTGRDTWRDQSLEANSLIIGLKFFSAAMIGELALQITERPKAVNIKLPAQ